MKHFKDGKKLSVFDFNRSTGHCVGLPPLVISRTMLSKASRSSFYFIFIIIIKLHNSIHYSKYKYKLKTIFSLPLNLFYQSNLLLKIVSLEVFIKLCKSLNELLAKSFDNVHLI